MNCFKYLYGYIRCSRRSSGVLLHWYYMARVLNDSNLNSPNFEWMPVVKKILDKRKVKIDDPPEDY